MLCLTACSRPAPKLRTMDYGPAAPAVVDGGYVDGTMPMAGGTVPFSSGAATVYDSPEAGEINETVSPAPTAGIGNYGPAW